MHIELLTLVICPECHGDLTLDPDARHDGDHILTGTLCCAAGHAFPIVGRVPRFVQHALNADQARTRDSFGDEWTRLYPEHGHTTPEWQAERGILPAYTRTLPPDFTRQLVVDRRWRNGRYAQPAQDWG